MFTKDAELKLGSNYVSNYGKLINFLKIKEKPRTKQGRRKKTPPQPDNDQASLTENENSPNPVHSPEPHFINVVGELHCVHCFCNQTMGMQGR